MKNSLFNKISKERIFEIADVALFTSILLASKPFPVLRPVFGAYFGARAEKYGKGILGLIGQAASISSNFVSEKLRNSGNEKIQKTVMAYDRTSNFREGISSLSKKFLKVCEEYVERNPKKTLVAKTALFGVGTAVLVTANPLILGPAVVTQGYLDYTKMKEKHERDYESMIDKAAKLAGKVKAEVKDSFTTKQKAAP